VSGSQNRTEVEIVREHNEIVPRGVGHDFNVESSSVTSCRPVQDLKIVLG
jgi:hypothetical protein